MLANLAVARLDDEIQHIANRHKLVYTRYADDLAMSTAHPDFDRQMIGPVIREVFQCMGRFGLSPNVSKTHVSPPGARKIVLGLLVDGPKPRLTREFKANLRQHLYYLTHTHVGPVAHAQKRGFKAVTGLRNHVEGLVGFARQIEPRYGNKCATIFSSIEWPI